MQHAGVPCQHYQHFDEDGLPAELGRLDFYPCAWCWHARPKDPAQPPAAIYTPEGVLLVLASSWPSDGSTAFRCYQTTAGAFLASMLRTASSYTAPPQ